MPLFHFLDERLIKRVQAARTARAAYFNEELFADPAWDILLELFAAELAQQRVAISNVRDAAGVPATTALRWINKLEQDEFVERESDPLDARRTWLALTPRGRSSMRSYFEAVSVTSLPL